MTTQRTATAKRKLPIGIQTFSRFGKSATTSTRPLIKQLVEGYADKYRHLGQPIHLIAVEFSKTSRNVLALIEQRSRATRRACSWP